MLFRRIKFHPGPKIGVSRLYVFLETAFNRVWDYDRGCFVSTTIASLHEQEYIKIRFDHLSKGRVKSILSFISRP